MVQTMSTELAILKNTGSRQVDISITQYYGGDKAGVCYQLTAEMEDGSVGYVQLSKMDLLKLFDKIADSL